MLGVSNQSQSSLANEPKLVVSCSRKDSGLESNETKGAKERDPDSQRPATVQATRYLCSFGAFLPTFMDTKYFRIFKEMPRKSLPA